MLPDFIIIGAMKCGTTSLRHYLGLHPEISVSRRKTRLGRAIANRAPLAWLARLNPSFRWHLERVVYRPFSTPIERPRLSGHARAGIAAALREEIALLERFAGRQFNWPTKRG